MKFVVFPVGGGRGLPCIPSLYLRMWQRLNMPSVKRENCKWKLRKKKIIIKKRAFGVIGSLQKRIDSHEMKETICVLWRHKACDATGGSLVDLNRKWKKIKIRNAILKKKGGGKLVFSAYVWKVTNPAGENDELQRSKHSRIITSFITRQTLVSCFSFAK